MFKLRMLLPSIIALTAVYAASTSNSYATPVAIGFPPPGVTFVGSGTSGSTAGKTNSYTVLLVPPPGYTQLFWAMEGIQGPLASTSVGTSQALTFAGFQAGTGYVWTAPSLWSIQTASGIQTFQTRFVLNVPSVSASTRGALGLSGNPSEPVFLINGNFSATFSFQAFNGSSWIGVNDLFNALSTTGTCSPCVVTSATGQFYGEPVPEPATMVLLGSGLVGVAGHARYRRNKKRGGVSVLTEPS